MKFKNLVLSVLLITTGVAQASTVRVSDFSLLDHMGNHHQLSYYSDQKAVVLVAHSSGAELALPAVATETDGIVAFYLNAMPNDTRTTLENAGDIPVLKDEAQSVAATLGMERVGDTLVIDPEAMTLLYKGDLAGLAQALPQALEGQAVVQGGGGDGKAISYAQAEGVSYSEDIAPMLAENCVSCHYEGGIGPWAMNSHAMVQGFSQMIREVVLTKRMPPGQIDQHVSKRIKDVAGLTTEEQRQLISWIDAGAQIAEGESDPLAEMPVPSNKWSLGEPDMVVKVAPQEIPATGVIDYRYVPVQLNLDRDVWVSAMEFIPGDRSVLHHVIAYVSSPADKTVRGRDTGTGENLAGFAPGRQPDQFWDNSGRLLKKGSNLLLQMHYTTSGRATVDETEVGIYLHKEPPTYVMSGGSAGQRRFLVPPYEKEYKLQGVQEMERDAYLYELNPHMHFRGKYMKYTAEYPDGTSELLLSVPRYDFNWQFNYVLEEPVFLPAGTKVVAHGAMDNSTQNLSNPDPSRPVHFGLQTMHEMFFGFTTFRYVGDTPENLTADKSKSGSATAAGGQ